MRAGLSTTAGVEAPRFDAPAVSQVVTQRGGGFGAGELLERDGGAVIACGPGAVDAASGGPTAARRSDTRT